MVDNQHRKITGFGELSEEQIATINAVARPEGQMGSAY